MSVKLTLPQDDFEALHVASASRRKPTSTVKVQAGVLSKLLMDHANVLAAAKDRGVKVEEAVG